MANRNNTVAARLSDGLFTRFNACIAREVASRPPVDEMDRYSQGTALRAAVLAWVEAMEADQLRPQDDPPASKPAESRAPHTPLMRATAPAAKKPTK